MYSFLLGMMYSMMLISVLIALPLLLILRLVVVIRYRIPRKTALLIVLLPFSYGYYRYLKKEQQMKLYRSVVTLLFVFAILGILFTLYQRFI
jgi:hypothetical protein